MKRYFAFAALLLLTAALFAGCADSSATPPTETTVPTEPVETVAPTEPFMPPFVPIEAPTEAQRSPVLTKSNTEFAEDRRTIVLFIQWLYDKEDRLIESRVSNYFSDGSDSGKINTTYRANGSRLVATSEGIVVTADEQGNEQITNQTYKKVCYYDEKDNLLQEHYQVFDANGAQEIDVLWQYEYDAGSNMTKQRWVAYYPNGQLREDFLSLHAASGIATEEYSCAYYENGALRQRSKMRQDHSGVPLEEYREFCYEDGSLSRLIQKTYSNGQLMESRELSCYENGVAEYDISMRYTQTGLLLEESRLQHREDGSPFFIYIRKYNENGDEVFFHNEQYYDNGTLQHKHLEKYDEQGQLLSREYLSYYEDGKTASIRLTEYAADGTLLKEDITEYNPDGSISLESKYPSDEEHGFMPVKELTYYENGNPERIIDALYAPDRFTLMSGKREHYYENGQPWSMEEATYDEKTRTRTASEIRYYEDGTEDFAIQYTETFDETGNTIVAERIFYNDNHTFSTHTLDRYTYDEAGRILTEDTTYYLEDGTIREKQYLQLDYDEKGREIRSNRSFRTANNQQTSRWEILRTYGNGENLLRQEDITYDAADAEEYRTIEEYNDQNQVIVRTTVHKDFTQVVTYTYDGQGRVIEEMSAITPLETEETTPTEEPVIDYRKTTFEYYESGEKKRQSVQYWTSEDEKNAEPGTDQSELGHTYVTEYSG